MLSKTKTNFVESFLGLHDLWKNVQMAIFSAVSSPQKIIDAVTEKIAFPSNPFKYMNFGLSILAISQTGTSLFSEELSFLDNFAKALMAVIAQAIYLTVTYFIFRFLSPQKHNSDEFLILSGVITGTTWVFTGIANLLNLVDEGLGSLVSLPIFIWMFFYSTRLYKVFWGIDFWKILLYSLLVWVVIIGFAVLGYYLFWEI